MGRSEEAMRRRLRKPKGQRETVEVTVAATVLPSVVTLTATATGSITIAAHPLTRWVTVDAAVPPFPSEVPP
jgi:hypothetical protein